MKPMPSVTAFALKVAAIVGMTCNHIANVFGSELPGGAMVALYSLGGLTFPIMAYLLCEGYRHTSSVRRVRSCLANSLFAAVRSDGQRAYYAAYRARDAVACRPPAAESRPVRAGPPWRAGRQFLLRLGHYRAAYDSAFLAFSFACSTPASCEDVDALFSN